MSSSVEHKKMLGSKSSNQRAEDKKDLEHVPSLIRLYGRMDYKPQNSAVGFDLPFQEESSSVRVDKSPAASTSRMMLNYEGFIPPLRKTAPRKLKGNGREQRTPFQPRFNSNNMPSRIDNHYIPSTVENMRGSGEHKHQEQEILPGVQNLRSEVWNHGRDGRVHGRRENPTPVICTVESALCDTEKSLQSSDFHCRNSFEDKHLIVGKSGSQAKVGTEVKYTSNNQDTTKTSNNGDKTIHTASEMYTNSCRISKKRRGKAKGKAFPLRVMPMRKVKQESTGKIKIDKSSELHVALDNNHDHGPDRTTYERECSLRSAYEKKIALSVEKSSVNFPQRNKSLLLDHPVITKGSDSPKRNEFDLRSSIINASSHCETTGFQQWQHPHGSYQNGYWGQSSKISGVGASPKLKQMDAMCQTSPLSKIYLMDQTEWEQSLTPKPKRSYKQKLVHRFTSRAQHSNKSPESLTTPSSESSSYKQKLAPQHSRLASTCSINDIKKQNSESEPLPVEVVKKNQCHPSVVMALKKLRRIGSLQKKSKAAISGKIIGISKKQIVKPPARRKSTKKKKLPQPKQTEKSPNFFVSDFQEHFKEWTKQTETKQYSSKKKKIGGSLKTLDQLVESRKRKDKDMSGMSSMKKRKTSNHKGKTDSVNVYSSGKVNTTGNNSKNRSGVITSETKADEVALTSDSKPDLKTTNSRKKSTKQKLNKRVAKTRCLKGETNFHSNCIKDASETLCKIETLKAPSDTLSSTASAWKDGSPNSGHFVGRIFKKGGLPNPWQCNSDQESSTSASRLDTLSTRFSVSSEDINTQLSMIRKQLMSPMCLSDSEDGKKERDNLSLRIIGSDIQVKDNSKADDCQLVGDCQQVDDCQQKNCQTLDLSSATNTEESNEEGVKSTTVCTNTDGNFQLPFCNKSRFRDSPENLSLDSGIDDESSEYIQQNITPTSNKETQSHICIARRELGTNTMQEHQDTGKNLSPGSMTTGPETIRVAAADTCLLGDADAGMSSVKMDLLLKSASYTNLIPKRVAEGKSTSIRCRRKSLEVAVERLKKFGIQKKKSQNKNTVDNKMVKTENQSDKCLENTHQLSCLPIMATDYRRKNHDKKCTKDGKLISGGSGVDGDKIITIGPLALDVLSNTGTQNKKTCQKTRKLKQNSEVSLLNTTEKSKTDCHFVAVEMPKKECDREMFITKKTIEKEHSTCKSEVLATEETLKKEHDSEVLATEETLEKEHQNDMLSKEETLKGEHCSEALATEETLEGEHCSEVLATEDTLGKEQHSEALATEETLGKEHNEVLATEETPGKEHYSEVLATEETLGKEHNELLATEETLGKEHCSEVLATEETLEKEHCSEKLALEEALEKEHDSEKLATEEMHEESCGSRTEYCGIEIQKVHYHHDSASQILEDKNNETEKVYTDLEIEDVLICKQQDGNVDDEMSSGISDQQKDPESSCHDSRSTAFIKYAMLKSQYWRGLGGWEESLRQKPNKTQHFQVEPKQQRKRQDKAGQVKVKDRKGEKKIIKDSVTLMSDDGSNASSKEMETENNADVGRLVWAKLGRERWWPGIIIKGSMAKMKSAEPGFYWIFWFGDHKISQIALEKVVPFVYNFNNMIGKKPGKLFQLGVLESLRICAERCELEEDYLVSHDALFHWAVQGFKIPENVCSDLRRSPFDPKPSENLPELVLENLQRLTDKAREKNDLDTTTRSRDERDSAMELVKSNEKNIQEICIACDDITKVVVTEHPLFQGGLCRRCKDELTETLYACGQDGTNVFCVICGCGGELFVCDMLKCGKAYCTECLEVFLGEALVTKIRKADPWRCLLCAPYNVSTHGQLKPNTDWQQRVVRLYDTGYRVQPADLTYLSSDNKKPIRVLSLFDGIGTGKLILDQLGFDVDVYCSSEIDHDALLITSAHHGNSVTQIGDITQLNEEKLQKLCPIDLVIGGSPCNDLSLANPARRGFEFGGTGMLFFHFYRVLKLVQILNHNRHVFWLYENVASMKTEFKNVISTFFECGPALWDAKYLTPQTRARYFWGNVPGMYSTPDMCEQYVGKSASLDLMLVQNCKRKAVVDKLRTVTTRSNSLKQGKNDDIFPISMNGKEDNIWISELEMVFGFPAHYTDVGNLPPTRRQKLLGKSWSVPVVQHILSPLTTYFSTKGDNSSLAQENIQQMD